MKWKLLIALSCICSLYNCKTEIEQTRKQAITPTQSSKFDQYDPLIWSARLDYLDGNMERAFVNFEKAFEIIPSESAQDLLYAASTALRIERDSIAEVYIRRAIKNHQPNKDYFDTFSELRRFHDKPFFKVIDQEYEQLVASYYDDLPCPKSIYEEVNQLVERDQEVRSRNTTYSSEMARVDSMNITRFIEITKECGWIDKGWILLWHHRGIHNEDNYVWNYFRPFINKQIEKGNMRKQFWAQYDDEKSINETRNQIYGNYMTQADMFPIIDMENVDKKRSEMGLPPLWYFNVVYGHQLPRGYTGSRKNDKSKWVTDLAKP